MASIFKKDPPLKLDLLTDINTLLTAQKGIGGGICHSIYRYAEANNECMKGYDKNKESTYLQYWNVNNLYVWAVSQKLPVNNFEWIKDSSQFNEDFIKNYIGESVINEIFLKLMFNIFKNYMYFIMIYYFYQKE